MKFKPIIAFLSLFIGGTIYLLWRPDSLIIFHWLDKININDSLLQLRFIISNNFITPPDWIIFSLPNSLWLLSGLILFELIWEEQKSGNKNFWIVLFCTIALGSEVAQLFNLIPGTIDYLDFALMFIAISFYLIIKSKSKLRGFYD